MVLTNSAQSFPQAKKIIYSLEIMVKYIVLHINELLEHCLSYQEYENSMEKSRKYMDLP